MADDLGGLPQVELDDRVGEAELEAAAAAVSAAVAVDDFAPQELSPRLSQGDLPSQAMSRPTAAE